MTQKITSSSFSNIFFIKWCILWLFAIHYFQPNTGGTGLAISFNNTTWIGCTAIIWLLLSQATRNKTIFLSKLTIAFILTFFVLLIPYIYPSFGFTNTQSLASESIGRTFGLLAGLLFFIALQQLKLKNHQLLRLINVVIAGILFQTLIIFLQFFFLEDGNFLKFDTTLNPYGLLQQTNVAASFLASGIILVLYSFYLQTYKSELPENTAIKYSKYACVVLLSFAVILTQSRTGMLAILTIAILGFIGSPNKIRIISRNWFFSILFGVLLGFASLTLTNTKQDTLEQISDIGIRGAVYSESLDMIKEKPLSGWGYGSFRWEFLNYYENKRVEQPELHLPKRSSTATFTHPHNELLYWGVEGGILAISAILLFTAFFFFQLFRQNEKLLKTSLFAPLIIHCMLELPFYHSAPSWLLFVFFIYLTDASNKKSYHIKHTFALRILVPFLSFLTIVFMVTNLHTIFVIQKHKKSRDIREFAGVVNPIGLNDVLKRYSLSFHYLHAVNTKNSKISNDFLIQVKDFIPYEPRFQLYQQYAHILLLQNQKEYAQSVIDEAAILFPSKELFVKGYEIIEKKN